MSADIKRITGTIPEFKPGATAEQLARRIEDEGGGIAEGVAMLIREQDKQLQNLVWQNGKLKETAENQEILSENQAQLNASQTALHASIDSMKKQKDKEDTEMNIYKKIGVYVISGGFSIGTLLLTWLLKL
jgi:hypothetical protein